MTLPAAVTSLTNCPLCNTVKDNCIRCDLDSADGITPICTECESTHTWTLSLNICKLICNADKTWRHDNTCVTCNIIHPHCSSCEESTVDCLTCDEGYFLDPDGDCIKQCDQEDSIYLNTDLNDCSPCGNSCDLCTNSTGFCENCHQGYLV